MKEFDVTITEKLQAVVTVQAETAQEAEQMVNDQWRSGDHVLDAENFVDVDLRYRGTELAQESSIRQNLGCSSGGTGQYRAWFFRRS